jgi:hypothetical protein
MTNGSNELNVSYSQIVWINKVIANHPNVNSLTRSNDIQFDIERTRGNPVRLVCINEYTCGLARVYDVLETFPGTNIIYVGGEWNSYTMEAKEYCLASGLGLYNSTEINGALHQNDFWTYHKKDRNGNPIYPTKAA